MQTCCPDRHGGAMDTGSCLTTMILHCSGCAGLQQQPAGAATAAAAQGRATVQPNLVPGAPAP